MGIGFSPHLPRFTRQHDRKQQTARDATQAVAASDHHLAGGFVEIDGAMAPETLFEMSLLANQLGLGPFSMHDIAPRPADDWSSPLSSFPLTDKTI